MIIDSLNEYSDAQAVTATAVSTNVIDHGAAGETLGNELYLHLFTEAAAKAAGAATVTFTLETATDAAFTSPVVLWTSSAIAKTDLTPSIEIDRVRVPKGRLQFTRTKYTVATGPLIEGTFNAFLSPSLQDQTTIA